MEKLKQGKIFTIDNLISVMETSIAETEKMTDTLVRNKYAAPGERTLSDIIERIISIVKKRASSKNVTYPTVCNFSDKVIDEISEFLRSGKFLPGGSILAGLTENAINLSENGKSRRKSSLSNCYIIPIKEDSIEGIFDAMKEMARTYSYRGGCGVDLTILRPDRTKVNNAAKTSTGAVSFMPLFSMTNGTIGQCLHKSTQVIEKTKGKITISRVCIGDEVWTANGFVKVVNVVKNKKPVYKITTVEGQTIFASIDHTFMAKYYGNNDFGSPMSDEFRVKELMTDTRNFKLFKLSEPKEGQSPILTEVGLKEIQKKPGNETVYDLALENTHYFWANGLYVHNSGRRGAAMISIDCRHPDLMSFIWCKADPEAVFKRDHMATDQTGRELLLWLSRNADKLESIDADFRNELVKIATSGKLPDINTANISVKFTNEFMEKAKSKDSSPWVFTFPDMSDMDFYNKYWDGNYDHWKACGGKLVEYRTHKAIITRKNYHRYIGRMYVDNGSYIQLTQKMLVSMLDDFGDCVDVELVNPSAYEILEDCAAAAWFRGDPGVLFWDAHCTYSDYPWLSDDLVPITTNPCGEISGYAYAACNLGAHVLYKYVDNPYTEKSNVSMSELVKGFILGSLFMNIMNDINVEMHPLKEQIDIERKTKRIGIEFTGLADMLSMLGIEYGSDEAIAFTQRIMKLKAFAELYVSNMLARMFSPCDYADPKKNEKGLKNLINNSDYYRNVVTDFSNYLNNIIFGYCFGFSDYIKVNDSFFELFGADGNTEKLTIENVEFTPIKSFLEMKNSILKYGLRNVATNTVGPTGSLSLLSDNCSSGIEPVFSFFTTRTTRVGDQKSYNLCHTPVARHLLAQLKMVKEAVDRNMVYGDLGMEVEAICSQLKIFVSEAAGDMCVDIDNVKKAYKIVEAYELSPEKRLDMQAAVQKYCDSSISSTINLSNDCTVEEMVNIYLLAYIKNLKGVTVFRDGSMPGVIEVTNTEEEKEKTEVQQEKILPDSAMPKVTEHGLIEMPDMCNAHRYAVKWMGYKMYLIVAVDAMNNPMELFSSNLPREIAFQDDVFNESFYQSQLTIWTALTRMISVSLRAGVCVDVIVKQLEKSIYTVNDLCAIIARVLRNYITPTDITHVVIGASAEREVNIRYEEREQKVLGVTKCPACGEMTLHCGGGCNQCHNPKCGYSKCL